MSMTFLETKTSTSYNKITDTHYVYAMDTYIDDETNEKIVKRHVVGKLNKDGEVVPTTKRRSQTLHGKPLVITNGDYKESYDNLVNEIQEQNAKDLAMKKQLVQTLKKSSVKISQAAQAVTEQMAAMSAEIDRFIQLLEHDDETSA